jgi:predicted RNA binding protein YcfA (HicA-like mRNA interferase family)
MDKFPIDAPKAKVIGALELLGFRLVKEREHIGFERKNSDGSVTTLSCPNHRTIKGSTLRTICTRAGISREDFMRAYERS